MATNAIAAKSRRNGITDIKITACPENNCSFPGFKKIPQDLNKYSRGSYVHLHFTDKHPHDLYKRTQDDLGLHDHPMTPTAQLVDNNIKKNNPVPITQIAVLQGQDADMGPGWEKLEGNLNDGNYGPVLTMFVRRDPDQAPIDSIVIKYGFDSHAAIGYDRLPMDLNVGTGPREPITQIATKACVLSTCAMDSSWTRINRPISTGTFKRYLYFFYKSVPGERPITDMQLLLDGGDGNDGGDNVNQEVIDTGVRFKNSNVLVAVTRGEVGDAHAIDNVAVELGANEIPFSWNHASFQKASPDQEVPSWNAQIIYRSGQRELPKTPTLRFHNDGTFKIVQFADMHMATGPHMCFNVPSTMNCVGDINTLMLMERMLEAERPDLVVFTGDNVDGLSSNDAYATILKYSRPVVERGIPWTIIFGNHDEEGDLSREEMIRCVQDIPFSLSERGPLDISGIGNYILSIYNPKRGRRPSLTHIKRGDDDDDDDEEHKVLEEKEKSRFSLYFLDSGAYSFSLQYPGYDWIKEDQVEWFRQQSKAITSQYRADDVPNALAFFHIPIPEYDLTEPDDIGDGDGDDSCEDDLQLRRRSKKQKGRDGDDKDRNERVVGDKRERVSSPSYNSGLFEAIFEMGSSNVVLFVGKDVRATTAGHDHLNDYCLDHRGIHLCYGGGIGYGTYGSTGTARRSRVFEIRSFGDRVETWKRLDDEDLSTVGHQTLFVGKKPVGRPESVAEGGRRSDIGSGGRKSKSSPQRMRDELFENARQGGQYVLNGLGNW
ncbi:purple acid phosphatase [Podila minutissima]|uniref:Purple acid phosphatase n=1 Tax=Podila minutissima TaxID=64525 RepID=A0A9P5SNC1_9FUNG|nr:purple acid phosphatase [Podila minutissima]